jgi:diacylglycerol kinase (ATP)
MRICIIFNPCAKGEKARKFRQHLDAFAGECALKQTTAAGGGRPLAAEAVREGYDTIVAAGGDGTLNEVLNGIGDEPGGFSKVRLGVLPVGTVNVFARELGMPLNLPQAWETIRRGRDTCIDLPQMEFEHKGQPRRRYFAQMAGAGWDAQAIDLVDWNLKKKIGQFAYMVAGLKAMHGVLPKIKVTSGSIATTGELVVIGNGRYYGGELPVFHRANFRDGLLDVCVFPKVGWLILLRYFWGFVSQRLFTPGDEPYFQTASLKLESATPAVFQLDGENVAALPASGSIQREALRVIVP